MHRRLPELHFLYTSTGAVQLDAFPRRSFIKPHGIIMLQVTMQAVAQNVLPPECDAARVGPLGGHPIERVDCTVAEIVTSVSLHGTEREQIEACG